MKIILIGIAASSIGFIVGVVSAINLFAIEVDILGLPYKNQPVELNQDIDIEQNDITISLPKGAMVYHTYTAKELPRYCLVVHGELFNKNNLFSNVAVGQDFYVSYE